MIKKAFYNLYFSPANPAACALKALLLQANAKVLTQVQPSQKLTVRSLTQQSH